MRGRTGDIKGCVEKSRPAARRKVSSAPSLPHSCLSVDVASSGSSCRATVSQCCSIDLTPPCNLSSVTHSRMKLEYKNRRLTASTPWNCRTDWQQSRTLSTASGGQQRPPYSGLAVSNRSEHTRRPNYSAPDRPRRCRQSRCMM